MARGDSTYKRQPADKITLAECQALIYAAFENAANDEEFVRRVWATMSRLSVEKQKKEAESMPRGPWWRFGL